MQPVVMLILENCPHCKNARRWMEELRQENETYRTVEVTIIDEEVQPELTRGYSYYYVPTYYVGGEKVHEGVPTKEIVQNVFEKALL